MQTDSLGVETTNFTDKTPYRGSSEHLRMIERFTPLGPDTRNILAAARAEEKK
jgi:hypothetical protein